MVSLHVNGKDYRLDVPGDSSLLWVLRDHKAERSCTLTVEEVEGKKITTIEGLPDNHPVKRAWIEEQVVQCGYCQPGVIMQVAALLDGRSNPNPQEIIESMDDVICRCGTYARMKRGIETAIRIMREEGQGS
ncbi:MAG: (2Fe-2S)-binding protein [Deltaproteobacteria bacterium]|nr:(2Fe-2S)-binding protein [Deltaproteobacteria bacterium]